FRSRSSRPVSKAGTPTEYQPPPFLHDGNGGGCHFHFSCPGAGCCTNLAERAPDDWRGGSWTKPVSSFVRQGRGFADRLEQDKSGRRVVELRYLHHARFAVLHSQCLPDAASRTRQACRSTLLAVEDPWRCRGARDDDHV